MVSDVTRAPPPACELDRERHDDLGEKGRERQRSHVNDATHTNRKPTILGPVMYSGHELR